MGLGTHEAALWGKFRDGMKKIQPLGMPILLDRIESPGTRRGIPDVFMADPQYGHCWIELKVANHNKINLTTQQARWLGKHAHFGTRCRIVALIKKPSLHLIRVWPGAVAYTVGERGILHPGMDVEAIDGVVDWARMRDHLFYDRMD